MSEQDRVLVQQVLAGEPLAFGRLVAQHRGVVRGYILNHVRHLDEAEDLVQEVFCRAYEKLPTLREPARFSPWLARLAANATASWWRRYGLRRRLAEDGDPLWESPVPPPDEVCERDEILGLLRQALDELAPACRQAVVLRYFEGFTYREIAGTLGLSMARVKWLLRKGKEGLRARLKRRLVTGGAPRR